MLSKAKQVCAVQNKLLPLFQFYCTKTPKNGEETTAEKDKKVDPIQQESSEFLIQSYDDDDCIKFEKRALKQIDIEKGYDANTRSRLSKECQSLFSPNTLVSEKCGPIRLDEIVIQRDIKDSEYRILESYSVDTLLIDSTTKSPVIENPTVPKKEKEDSKDKEYIIVKTTDDGGIFGGTVISPNRPIRQEPGKVIFGFIPEEWWRELVPRTGVTGFGTFFFTFFTYLVSKEIYVLEHYFYHGLGAFFLWVGAIKTVGPPLARYLDKEVDKVEQMWKEGREHHRKSYEDDIYNELLLQFQIDGQLTVLDAKRENVMLQYEENFRLRQMQVYKEVLERLNYHVAVELIKRRIQHKNLVEYVTNEVRKSITEEMQTKLIYYSIDQIVKDVDSTKK